MKTKVPHAALTIKKTKNKGRGVFAAKNFSAGENIEECPAIVVCKKTCEKLNGTELDCYFYAWRNQDEGALLLGYGWLYNHSYKPNAVYIRNFKHKVMIYKAIKDIPAGEEICVNYNGSPDNKEPIDWLNPKE